MKIQDEEFKEKELIQEINSGVQGWDELSFEQIGQWIGGYAFKSSDFENTNIENECMQVLKMGNVKMGLIDICNNHAFIHKDKLTDRHKDFVLKSGDILISLTGTINKTDYGNVAPVEIDDIFILNQRVARFRTQSRLQRNFFYYYMQGKQFRNKFFLLGLGGTGNQANVGISDLKAMTAPVPPTCEQEKIAEIISTWDKAIELKEKLIEEKKKQKSGLMQKLLTGKVRLPGFDGEWKNVRLGSVIKNKTEKSTINNQHEVLSCTKDGVVSQNKHFNKQIASENNIGYKILRQGELVLSPMNLWLGGIDISKFDIGIVSPAYKVYEIDYSIVGENYLRNCLRSEYMISKYESISQKGASIVRRNLNIKDFEDLTIAIPEDSVEMTAIDSFISLITKEIYLLEKELDLLKQQKKGLMQLLLTGIVRVNVETN